MISEFEKFFMFSFSTRAATESVVESADTTGEEVALDEVRGASEGAKWMVMVAGSWLDLVRSTIMGTAGLWYLSRMSSCRQKSLRDLLDCCQQDEGMMRIAHFGPLCPPLVLSAKRMWIRWTSLGRTTAPEPNRIARSLFWSLRMRCGMLTMMGESRVVDGR